MSECWCGAVGLADHDVTVGEGWVRIHVGGVGPPLVLLHGNPTHAFLWRHVIAELRSRFRCFAVDLPGFGASSGPIGLGVAEHARVVAEAVQRLVPPTENWIWLAHDWGVAIAFNALAQIAHAGEHRIAFTEGHLRWIPSWESTPPGFAGLFRRLRELEFGNDFVVGENRFIQDVLLASLPQLTDSERNIYRKPFADPARRPSILALAREVPVAGDPPDMVAPLKIVAESLSDPLLSKLLIAGEPGAVIDTEARGWINAHADKLVTVHVGPTEHFVPEEQPEAIARALREWIDDLG